MHVSVAAQTVVLDVDAVEDGLPGDEAGGGEPTQLVTCNTRRNGITVWAMVSYGKVMRNKKFVS